MKVKEAEELVGLSAKTIKFYEEEGLVFPRRNSSNGYREYTLIDIERLKEIKLLRNLGLSINNIKTLINDKEQVEDILEKHIKELDEEIKNICKRREICLLMIERDTGYKYEEYVEKVKNLEKDGYKFMSDVVKEKEYLKEGKKSNKYMALFIIVTLTSSLLSILEIIPKWWGIFIIVAAVIPLILRHHSITAYNCSICGNKFRIKLLEDIFSLNDCERKLVKCPHCKKRSWNKETYID